MKILGYSERGIINSLIFSIGEDIDYMNQFVELITLRAPFELGEPISYTILLEQSFSQFGDADLVIIIHYKHYENLKDENPEDKKVLFIEGKVKTFKGNWNIVNEFNKFDKGEKYPGSSSNLFFQLYLKKLMIDNWQVINKDPKSGIASKFERQRKIGENGIVRKAFNLIACKEAYYIGLIPTSQDNIDKFKKDNNSGLHFLSWEKVHKFCNDHDLKKVLEIFEHNDEQIYKRDKITVQKIQ